MVSNPAERNTLVVGVCAALCVGAGAVVSTPLALSIAAIGALLLAATSLRPHHAVALLVLTSYLNRVRVPIAGFGFRLEHLATAVLVTVVLVRRPRQVGRAISHPAVIFLLAFVAWSAFVSLRAPDVSESMQIVGWLVLDAAMVVALLSAGHPNEKVWESVVRYGLWASGYGIGAWLAAAALSTSVGVQVETLTGAPAVYGLSFEANIYGSTMALLLMGLICLGVPRGIGAPVFVVYGLPLAALLLSFTRAAVLGLLLGVAVWALLSRSLRVRTRILSGTLGAAFILAVVGLVAPGSIAPLVQKASQAVDFAGGTGAVRAATWTTAIDDLTATDWLVGRGANSYGQYHLDPTVPEFDRPGYIGNLPLQLVYDSGLVGTALLLVALLWAMPRGRIGRARAVAMLTVYLACALATSPFWFVTTWLYFTIGLRSHTREGDEPAGRRQLGTATRRPVVAER